MHLSNLTRPALTCLTHTFLSATMRDNIVVGVIMNTFLLFACSIFLVVLGVTLFFLIRSKKEATDLRTKYDRIIDVDKERERLQKDIEALSVERDRIKVEFMSKKASLIKEYDTAHDVFQKLQREINLLEESLDMIEFGVYKPHFDYETPDEFERQIENLQGWEKEMIRSGRAVTCEIEWTVQGSKSEGKKMTGQTHKLMLRAFNGECDAALAKVRWDNILKMEERINKAYETINKSAAVNRSYITKEYLDLKIRELRLTFEYQEKIKQEKDEQRRIREEMRDEEIARREIERAKEEAEKEEVRYSKALEKAHEEMSKASGEKVAQLNDKIMQLEAQLKAAQEMKERAISRAQITKSGHIYIISNIGSFGDNVYKIGMTRRLDPIDRIRELSDASVPFGFDVHAMLYTENAPELENKIHKQFEINRMNLVNPRREFFAVALDEIEKWAKTEGVDLQLTKIAEAREYRETMAIRAKDEESIKTAVQQDIPESINGLFTEEDEDTLYEDEKLREKVPLRVDSSGG